jgi:hypothetical protein
LADPAHFEQIWIRPLENPDPVANPTSGKILGRKSHDTLPLSIQNVVESASGQKSGSDRIRIPTLCSRMIFTRVRLREELNVAPAPTPTAKQAKMSKTN